MADSAPFDRLAEQMAIIRDSCLRRGFTREESVSIARAWLVVMLEPYAKQNAGASSLSTKELLEHLKIGGQPS